MNATAREMPALVSAAEVTAELAALDPARSLEAPKRARKPRGPSKKNADALAEARQAGYLEGIEDMSGIPGTGLARVAVWSVLFGCGVLLGWAAF